MPPGSVPESTPSWKESDAPSVNTFHLSFQCRLHSNEHDFPMCGAFFWFHVCAQLKRRFCVLTEARFFMLQMRPKGNVCSLRSSPRFLLKCTAAAAAADDGDEGLRDARRKTLK